MGDLGLRGSNYGLKLYESTFFMDVCKLADEILGLAFPRRILLKNFLKKYNTNRCRDEWNCGLLDLRHLRVPNYMRHNLVLSVRFETFLVFT